MIPLICNIQNKQIYKSKKTSQCLGLARGETMGMIANGYGIFFWKGGKNVLKLDCSGDSQFCEYTKTHRSIYFKRVNFMVCELYINRT